MLSAKLLLVDDHAVVRSGLRRLLELNQGIEVIAEADSGEQAYQLYGDLQPDIVVMDISMPGMGGLESARRIIKRHPAAKIIIFSMHETASFASQALKAGVKGYVTKTGVAEDLANAVIAVARGNTFLTAEIAEKIALQSLSGDDDPIQQLSAREFEVFRLLADGKKMEEVADMLKISQKTVANHYTIIKQKLNVSSPIEMVRFAIRHGLIEG
ncbi:response regulator transcription factor [Methylotenera sp.]|uniref:response regulator n=3 Tax=Methylotenera sp. TaxID=2051956 RepID=UPI0027254B6D|nr:response regulator transcription factor [Methylotenera sp.]MDO9205115.1 response regulator transcription factor [Methylotenera sp.]MDP1523554.1 response regulator transcription factor [Methylotenera sp.]MDP1657972.1 response regulator transcription factor [Methylotenera sp.]MDP2229933.1 response regulator transcription factor [Methylotenera sp.]MDP3006095.1 response regulator transcription factor [Methylotenera sp.]